LSGGGYFGLELQTSGVGLTSPGLSVMSMAHKTLVLFHNLDYGAPGEAGEFQPVKVRFG